MASISTSLCTTIGRSQYHRSIVGVAVKSRAGKGWQSHKEEGGWHRLGYRSIRQNQPVQGCVSPLMPKGVMRQTWRSPRSPVILVVGAAGLGACIWHSPIDRPRAESIGQSHGRASASHNPTVSKSAQVDACGAYRNPTPEIVKLTCKPLTRHPCTAQPRQPAGAPCREAFSRLAGCCHECKAQVRSSSVSEGSWPKDRRWYEGKADRDRAELGSTGTLANARQTCGGDERRRGSAASKLGGATGRIPARRMNFKLRRGGSGEPDRDERAR